MSKNNKILAIIIIIKRKNRNSFLLKRSYESMAKDFCLSPNTLRLYIQWAVEEGYLIKEYNGWRAKDFFTIVKKFCWKNKMQLRYHRLLQKKTINFKKVLKELEIILYHDSLLAPQFGYVNQDEYARNVFKKAKSIAGKKISEKREVTSSVRHISNKFSYGHKKSLAILKAKTHLYTHKFNFEYRKGCTRLNMESLRSEFPNAHLVPIPGSDSIKVCHGTTMNCSRQKKSYSVHGKKVGVNEMILIAERLQATEKARQGASMDRFSNDQIVSLMNKAGNLNKRDFFKSISKKKWNPSGSLQVFA